ncbi:MAG: hypothetical protein Q9168_004414 [Polycauliona sp. 1 TL-2023]
MISCGYMESVVHGVDMVADLNQQPRPMEPGEKTLSRMLKSRGFEAFFRSVMKLAHSVAPLLLSTAVASKSFLFGNQQQPLVDDSLSVPGDNPLEFCADPSKYILTIDRVDLDPNPPQKGQALSIKAKGNFTEKIEQDAYINLSVKYGLITLVNTRADLCDQMKEVDESCPLEGAKDFTKDVTLPKEIPRGTYHVLADVYTNDDEQITCLKATVHFS